MNNDIKFRIWDISKNIFIRPIDIRVNGSGEIGISSGVMDNYIPIIDNLTIQRFTGLKDKEGKEIYEGDKLFVDEGIWLVVFRLGAFMVQEEGFPESNFGLLYEYNQDAFVVGNIFEKSE